MVWLDGVFSNFLLGNAGERTRLGQQIGSKKKSVLIRGKKKTEETNQLLGRPFSFVAKARDAIAVVAIAI